MSSWHCAQVSDPANVAPATCGGAITVRLTVAQEITIMAVSTTHAAARSLARCPGIHSRRTALIRPMRVFMGNAGRPTSCRASTKVRSPATYSEGHWRETLPELPSPFYDLDHRASPPAQARRPARERISISPRRVARMPRRASALLMRIAVSTLVPANSASVARVCGITRPNFS